MNRIRGRIAALCVAFMLGACCGTPDYSPNFWNSSSWVRTNNNCYNYSNNKRTDTFAQPGRASGTTLGLSNLNCADVTAAAIADGIEAAPSSATCPSHCVKIALVINPGVDYHWYRLDSDGMWTHKPGQTAATNLDNSGNPITNPETADRGGYTIFCGYFCICSSSTEGNGHENIN
ncbi:MAG: hypothetical protein ACYTGZ_21240 [Planctomycetota bacterium]|jgi:hypothetical protein